MSTNSYWQTEEDIMKDLYEYSGLEYPGNDFAPVPPKSVSEYRARTSKMKQKGLFDEEPEEVGIFVSGRGKYQVDRIMRPGLPVEHLPEDDSLIQKKIREVSGLGYGNEMIEREFRSKGSTREEECEELFAQIKLTPESTSSSPSKLSPQKIQEEQPSPPAKKPSPTQKKSTKKKKFVKWCSDNSDSSSSTVNDVEIWRSNFRPNVNGNCMHKSNFPNLK